MGLRKTRRKLHSRAGGVTWAAALLLAAVAVLAASLLVPWLRTYRESADASACAMALNEAQRKINDTAIVSGGSLTADEARRAATQNVKNFSELCPAGGDCGLLADGSGGYTVVCALHTSDAALRTRLNAENALERSRAALETALLREGTEPESLNVTLNGKPFTVDRVDGLPQLRGGTRVSEGVDGTAAWCVTDGGEIVEFCYADEEHNAAWRASEGWTLDGVVTAS